ncbi:unnamed protein product [Arctogadus glacialis]
MDGAMAEKELKPLVKCITVAHDETGLVAQQTNLRLLQSTSSEAGHILFQPVHKNPVLCPRQRGVSSAKRRSSHLAKPQKLLERHWKCTP